MLKIMKKYKRASFLMAIVAVIAGILFHILLIRPVKLLKEYRCLRTELNAKLSPVKSPDSTFLRSAINLDRVVMKEITSGGCAILQSNMKQIAADKDMELMQYEVAYAGNYSDIMTVWKNLLNILGDTACITHLTISPEKYKSQSDWEIVCRVTIQMIRLI